ncbi:MAG: nuclease [Acidobacteriaceae bacterium]
MHGGVAIKGKLANLISNASITAYDRTAKVKLKRGGDVLVCSTSQFHLMQVGKSSSLLFGLDRGAIELHTRTEPQDVILTPDIRFQVKGKGVYDLRLRVTSNGDTCVQNAGNKAPVLMLSDAFSSANYRMLPGQHVLFEDGNLRAVVDSEDSPCGCPDKQKSKHVGSTASPAQKASAEHPFPVAQSEGLAPVTPAPNSPPGQTETQIATTLSYTPGQPPPPNAIQTPAEIIADGQSPLAPQGMPNAKHSFGYRMKRFFYRLFHPWSSGQTSS